MEFDDIERILELMHQHDLSEFELEREGLKAPGPQTSSGYAPLVAPMQMPSQHAVAPQPPPTAVPDPRVHRHRFLSRNRRWIGGREIADCRHVLPVARARRAVICRSGDRVKKDQVLCIIEAMKLMNEITSNATVSSSAYVENGQPVQHGERLFAIKTT